MACVAFTYVPPVRIKKTHNGYKRTTAPLCAVVCFIWTLPQPQEVVVAGVLELYWHFTSTQSALLKDFTTCRSNLIVGRIVTLKQFFYRASACIANCMTVYNAGSGKAGFVRGFVSE